MAMTTVKVDAHMQSLAKSASSKQSIPSERFDKDRGSDNGGSSSPSKNGGSSGGSSKKPSGY
jgi:hypothetical protein